MPMKSLKIRSLADHSHLIRGPLGETIPAFRMACGRLIERRHFEWSGTFRIERDISDEMTHFEVGRLRRRPPVKGERKMDAMDRRDVRTWA